MRMTVRGTVALLIPLAGEDDCQGYCSTTKPLAGEDDCQGYCSTTNTLGW